MNYPLELLRSALKHEKESFRDAKKWLKENKDRQRRKDDVQAFETSLELALERLPQLHETISNITRMEQLKKHS